MKNLYLIVGASGTGKSALIEKISEKYDGKIMQSCTDRLPRYEGETGHIFLSEDEFTARLPMVAYTVFNGHRYGVTADMIDDADLYAIDPAGVIYLYRHYKGKRPMKVIGITASRAIIYDRLMKRDKNISRISHDEDIFTESVMKLICDDVIDNSMHIDFAFKNLCEIIDKYEEE